MTQKTFWNHIRSKIKSFSSNQYLEIISELYKLNKENKNFLESRYLYENTNRIKPYKEIIEESLFPDVMRGHNISLKTGKKAISDYKKATKDEFGTIELMLFYVECGHKFTSEYGDMYESFYNSLISVFDNIIKLLKKHPEHKNAFYDRMQKIANESRDFGWGYDEMHDLFTEANL